MNERKPKSWHDDPRQIDLLVDGELDDPRRRELLVSFENDPGGWQRCALAFLEAQEWKKQLPCLPRETGPRESVAAARQRPPDALRDITVVQPQKPWKLPPLATALALAAGLMLAFSLGWAIKRGGQSDAGQGTNAHGRPDARDLAGGPRPASNGSTPVTTVSAGGRQPWGNLRVVVPGRDGVRNEIEVPVFDQESELDPWSDQPSAIPDEVRRALEQRGHKVRQQRQWLPLDLDDGRRVIVPVDEVEVLPVSIRPY